MSKREYKFGQQVSINPDNLAPEAVGGKYSTATVIKQKGLLKRGWVTVMFCDGMVLSLPPDQIELI